MFAFAGKADLASHHGRAAKLELHLLKPTTRCGVGVAPLEAWANPLSGFWRVSILGRVVILAARLF